MGRTAGKRIARREEFKAVYNARTDEVIVAMRWSGFMRARCAFVVVVNGELQSMRGGNGPETKTWYDFYRPVGVAVTEEQAREHLQRLIGVHTERCTQCSELLQVSAPWCHKCGAAQGFAKVGV